VPKCWWSAWGICCIIPTHVPLPSQNSPPVVPTVTVFLVADAGGWDQVVMSGDVTMFPWLYISEYDFASIAEEDEGSVWRGEKGKFFVVFKRDVLSRRKRYRRTQGPHPGKKVYLSQRRKTFMTSMN
jgi:hypothetical protein